MGCSNSVAIQKDYVQQIKQKRFEFKSKTEIIGSMKNAVFVDKNGLTYHVVGRGKSLKKVPVLEETQVNSIVQRRRRDLKCSSFD